MHNEEQTAMAADEEQTGTDAADTEATPIDDTFSRAAAILRSGSSTAQKFEAIARVFDSCA